MKKYELPEPVVIEEPQETSEEEIVVLANEAPSEDSSKASKKEQPNYETIGINIYRNRKITYLLFCTGWGYLITFVIGQIVSHPLMNTPIAKEFAAWFGNQIGALDGSGPTAGIVCTICSLILVMLNLLVRIINKKKFSKAKEYAERVKHIKNGGWFL